MGFFNRPFDLNRDGKLSPKERALKFAMLSELLEEDEDEEEASFYEDDDTEYDSDDEF